MELKEITLRLAAILVSTLSTMQGERWRQQLERRCTMVISEGSNFQKQRTSSPLGLATEKQGVRGKEQKFTVLPESAEVNAGDDVFLRCVVQNQQGKTQWTKDGFALGFERDVPGYPRYSYAGDSSLGQHHLVIHGATLDDDGEYQCQVGPTANTSALWAKANVTVMVAPTSINVIGGADGASIEGIEGQSLHLQCLVKGARPAPSVAWYKNGHMIDPGHHTERVEMSPETRRWSARSRLVIVPRREDDGQQYSCRALHPSLMSSPTSLVARITLDVLYPPQPPKVRGFSPGDVLKEGDILFLACQSHGGNPRPKLTWYRNGRLLKHPNISHTEALREEEPVRVSVKLKVRPEDDRAIYECQATSKVLNPPLFDGVTLNVLYSPSRVALTGPSVAAVGEEFMLTCVTSKSNPSASINWFIHGVQVATVSSQVNEADGGGWVTSSNLRYRLDNSIQLDELTVECKAYNSVSNEVITETRVISVIRPPGYPVMQVEAAENMVAGDLMVIICSTEGGNPKPGVTIYKGREKLPTEVRRSGHLTEGKAAFEVTAADNELKVRCEVNNPATKRPLEASTEIKLQYPPWEIDGWVEPNEVEAGQDVALVCESSTSLPPSALIWRSGTLVLHSSNVVYSEGIYGGTVTRSELEMKVLIEDNGRSFTCDADNGLGVTITTNITLNVLHGPVWTTTPTGTVEVQEKDDLILVANADANPSTVNYTWWRGPLAVENMEEPEEGHQEGRLLMKRVHRQEAGGYSVTATNPKGTVNASFVINVLYGPENIIASKRVNVDETGSASVLCTAIGNPTPNVTWFKQEFNNSEREVLGWGIAEARLLIKGARRSDTGFYWCSASNAVSEADPVASAVVVSQVPEPPLEEVDEDDGEVELFDMTPWANISGTGRLKCVVRAAPAPNFRWNIYDDRVLFNDRKYFIRLPQLVDGLLEWLSVLEIRNITQKDYTTYTCTVTNSRGTYTFNHTLNPPVAPNPPQYLNVTNVIGSTAYLSWVPPTLGTPPDGYFLQYRQQDGIEFTTVKVTGRRKTAEKVQGLAAGTTYEFVIQSFSGQGWSGFTSPHTLVIVPGVEGEVASSSSQPRVARLTLLLMSLTGVALLVLNISIIICFVKRYARCRGAQAAAFKPIDPETYTLAAPKPCVVEDDVIIGSSDTISTLTHCQMSHQPLIIKEDIGRSSSTPHHQLVTEIKESPKHREMPKIPSSEKFLPNPSKQYKSALYNGGLNAMPGRPHTPRSSSPYSEQFTTLSLDTSQQLDDNISRRMKVTIHPSDIPDVCPKSPGSTASLSRHRSQEINMTCPDDCDRISMTSHHSTTPYMPVQDQACGLERLTPSLNRRRDNTSPPLALIQPIHNRLRSASCCEDITNSKTDQSHHLDPSSTPCCSKKPTSQVIYHGQPHIQEKHEREQQQQEQLHNLEHHHHIQPPQQAEHHQFTDHYHVEHHQQHQEDRHFLEHDQHLDQHQHSNHHQFQHSDQHERLGHPHPQHLEHQQQFGRHHLQHLDQPQHSEHPPPHQHHLQHLDQPQHSEHPPPHPHHLHNFQHPSKQHHVSSSHLHQHLQPHHPLSQSHHLLGPRQDEFRDTMSPCCTETDKQIFYQPPPCCHRSTIHIPMHEHHQEKQLLPPHQQLYPQQQLITYPLQKSHSLPRKRTPYHYMASERPPPLHHQPARYRRSFEEPSSYHPGPIPQELRGPMPNPIPHSQSEYRYPIQYPDLDYPQYPDHQIKLQADSKYGAEAPTYRPQFTGLDPSSLYSQEAGFNEASVRKETTLEL